METKTYSHSSQLQFPHLLLMHVPVACLLGTVLQRGKVRGSKLALYYVFADVCASPSVYMGYVSPYNYISLTFKIYSASVQIC